MINYKQIGPILSGLRKDQKLSLRELAIVCDMHEPQLCEIEKGDHIPGMKTLDRICDGLKVPMVVVLLKAASTEDRIKAANYINTLIL